jgi:hypothetical protein
MTDEADEGKGAGELILYRTEDGRDEIQLRLADGSVWLTQAEIAILFDTTKQNVSHHIKEALASGELEEAATVKDYLTVQTEGARQVSRTVRPVADRQNCLEIIELHDGLEYTGSSV